MADTTYCTSDEVKQWLGIDDVNLDWIADLAISSTSRWVDGKCGRRFWKDAEVVARVYDVGRDGTVRTDDIADLSGLVVKTDSAANGGYATTLDASSYQVLPLDAPYGLEPSPWSQIAPTGNNFPFPMAYTRRGLIQVTAKWGWPAVPEAVHQATIMQAARIVKRRTSPEGVAGFSDFGAVRVSSTDRDVDDLLQPYVLMGFC